MVVQWWVVLCTDDGAMMVRCTDDGAVVVRCTDGGAVDLAARESVRRPRLFADCHRDSSPERELTPGEEKKKQKKEKGKNPFRGFGQMLG